MDEPHKAAVAWRVAFPDGRAFPCREDESVLEAMRRAGFGPRGCFGGGCGICKMRIARGVYRIVKQMSRAHVTKENEEEGIVLLCCVQPRSDLLLVDI